MTARSTLGALAVGLLLGSFSLGVMGADPLQALSSIFLGSFASAYGFGETVTKAIPLMLAGTGLALAFRGRLWNIGAEGQLLAGAVAATGAALSLKDLLPGFLMVPALFAAGAAGGAAWGLLAGWLKTRFQVNEVIGSLMLNYIAAEAVQYLIYGPWKGATQFGFPYTDNFCAAATLPVIAGTRVHAPTLAVALAAAGGAFWALRRMRFGFEVRALGGNPEAARYAGIDPARTALILMALSGGLAGLAGAGEAAGIHHHLTYPWAVSSGYGYSAIIVAWVAGLNPLLVVPSALFLGGILVGGDAIQTSMGLPASAISLFNGILLLSLMGGEFFARRRPQRSPSPLAGEGRDGGPGHK
ncbi:MAG TPA: ABC transporter permease [Elusimicrobia bacterium]|nr:ABC transporter permease [Elusimicrobiota bacterium]